MKSSFCLFSIACLVLDAHLASGAFNTINIAKSIEKTAENQLKARSVMQNSPLLSQQQCDIQSELFADLGNTPVSSLWNHTINWQQVAVTQQYDNGMATQNWFANGTATNTSAYLTSLPVSIPADTQLTPFLSFWHKYDTERGYDGCMVYYTADAGQSWHDMGPYFVQGGYNFQIISQQGALQAFTGDSMDFNETIADLSDLRGQTIQFSFVLITDISIPSVGWSVGNIRLYEAVCDGTSGEGVTPTAQSTSQPQPSQGGSNSNSNNNSNTNYINDETRGFAVAALIISIIVAVALLFFIVTVSSVYYAQRKKSGPVEVPMVKITSPAH